MYLFKKYRKKGTGKRRPPSEYKRAMDLLDKIFSIYIRLRGSKRTGGKCEICGIRSIDCCFHFYPRQNMILRFEPDGACASCRGCNWDERMRRGTASGDQRYYAAHVRLVGESRVKELDAMKGQPFKKSAAELMEIKRHFEKLLAEGR